MENQKTINTKDFLACFVNSNDPPKDIKPWSGFYVTQNGDELTLFGNREYVYPHPDVPEDAIISVNRVDIIITVKPGDWKYAVLFSMLQSQNMVKDLLNRIK